MRLFKPTNPKIVFAAFLLFLLSAPAIPADVAPPAGETAPSVIQPDTANAILQELREIRRVLEKIEKQGNTRAAKRSRGPETAKIALNKNRPVMGAADAPVTVVEFTDYQCPFCLRFIKNTFPNLKKDYINTGKVRWVVLDMPLSFHKDALKAARAAHCAGDQGKFWEMRELLFANSRKLAAEFLPGYAGDLGLNVEDFKSCLDSDKHQDEIDRDAQLAKTAGLTGTPSFVIGKTTSGNISGKVIIGARPQSVFETTIQEALGKKP
jgi:protein-disulfide isomerase